MRTRPAAPRTDLVRIAKECHLRGTTGTNQRIRIYVLSFLMCLSSLGRAWHAVNRAAGSPGITASLARPAE